MAAAIVGALALVAGPKAADALTLQFTDLAPGGPTVTVSDGDDADQSGRAGVIALANLSLGDNFVIDVATARSNALAGSLPAWLNVNITAFADQAGQLRVRAWDDFVAGPAANVPAFFAASATLRGAGSTAVAEARVDDFLIGSIDLMGTDASGHRSTTVALGDTFRLYQEFTINVAAGQFANVDGFVEVIPVPAALPLMLGGLGMLGFLGWRRRAA